MSSISSLSSATPLPGSLHGAQRAPAGPSPAEEALTPSEKKQLEELQRQDADVRRHEQAHLAAAGPYAKGPPQYDYKTGPDGKQYAVGGHVDIDTEKVEGNPEATLRKARVVRRAALAPREPSAQDRKVAREADQMAREAERELQAAADDPSPHGYDRKGSPLTGSSAPARIDVLA